MCSSGPEKGVITKGVFSLEESLDSLESLENGRILLWFPQSGGALKSLEESLRPLFQKTPVGIVQKVFSPKGVPRIFDAFLTQF